MIDKSKIAQAAQALLGTNNEENWASYIAAANPTAILKLLAELESARNAALEEAAKEVERKCEEADLTYKKGILLDAACGIRALATTTSTEPAKEPQHGAKFANREQFRQFSDFANNRALHGEDYDNAKEAFDLGFLIAATGEQSNMAGAARQGGNTCDNGASPAADAGGLTRYAPMACTEWGGEMYETEIGEYFKVSDVIALLATKAAQAPAPSAKQEPRRNRESDRIRFTDPKFNTWLDEGISDMGHTVWDQISDTADAWAGWENREYYAPASASASPADYQLTLDAVQAALGDSYDPERGLAMSVFVLKKAFDAEAKLGETYKQIALAAPVAKFDQAEFEAMVEKGTAAWANVPDNWLEEIRGNVAAPVAGSQQVPEGWKPVPVEPTLEMIAALGFGGDVDLVIGHAAIAQNLEEIYAAMLAAAPAVPVPAEQWLPIEAAPKDGSAVLLSRPDAGGAWIGKYEPVYQSGYRPDNPWFSLMLNRDYLPKPLKSSAPTHWMPLPAAPSLQQGKEGAVDE